MGCAQQVLPRTDAIHIRSGNCCRVIALIGEELRGPAHLTSPPQASLSLSKRAVMRAVVCSTDHFLAHPVAAEAPT